MKLIFRILQSLIVILLLSGCFYFQRPWSYPITVKLINAFPCFTIPGDRAIRQHNPMHNGFMLQKVVNGKYELVWATQGKPDNVSLPVKINECLLVEFDNWQAGKYALSTGVWFDDGIDNRYYRVKFSLIRDPHTQQLKLSD